MKYLSIGKIIILSAIPFVFMLIPPSFFTDGTSLCLIKNLSGVNCPGCGTIRAISSIFHFQFIEAWNYNKSIIIVFPLLGYIWFKFIIIELCSLLPDKAILNKFRKEKSI